MLEPGTPLAAYAEGAITTLNAKMTEGLVRYGRDPVVAVIDSGQAGRDLGEVMGAGHGIPIVATLAEAAGRGARALVLGIAPSGGRIPESWSPVLEEAVERGMSLVNGLHDPLRPRFAERLAPGQVVWDIRVPQDDMPPIASARARGLGNRRVLMVGTDMAVGKKTTGLELDRALRAMGADSVFLATGQGGIAITGRGIPLDAFRVDHAAGAVERMVMEAASHDVLVIEGQGSLLHPGSTATLPLLRGSCANALVLCHRAGATHLDTLPHVAVPPLREVIALNEAVARAAGALTAARVVALSLNTRRLTEEEARAEIARVEDETGLPATDPVRFGPRPLARAVLGLGPEAE
jgi:uncharacterized NAD-dependent epimerase/dehydratase family protein